MEVVRGISALRRSLPHAVVTIGNFDGLHRGHQRIIQLAKEKASLRQGSSIVYTFRPHPHEILRPQSPLSLLSTYDERISLLAALGADLIVEEPFNLQFSEIESQQFFSDVILKKLNAEAVVVGYDFSFGRGKLGQLENLANFCKSAGVELTVVPPQKVDDEVVSSSLVRRYLLDGNIESANKLLGRDFSYRGLVVHGEGRGRQIGFPTANLEIEKKLLLPLGVYATWAELEGRSYPSVTNIGVRPTFNREGSEQSVCIETFLIDTTLDLYDRTLELRFIKRLREEKRFAGVGPLKIQITQDVDQAKELLRQNKPGGSAR